MSGRVGRPYEAVLFDFDGVLVDSEPVHYACWRDVLAPLGIPLEWEVYRTRCIGVADQKLIQLFCTLAGPSVDYESVHSAYPRKRDLFRERMLASLPMADSTRSLFDRLSRYKLAVVSSSSRPEVEPPLQRAGVLGYLDAVVYGEDVASHKPSPEPYVLAAKRLGIRTALVVEDSEAGEASGRAAGFDVLRVPHPSATGELVAARLGFELR